MVGRKKEWSLGWKKAKARSHRKIEMGKEETESDSHGTKMEYNWELNTGNTKRMGGCN